MTELEQKAIAFAEEIVEKYPDMFRRLRDDDIDSLDESAWVKATIAKYKEKLIKWCNKRCDDNIKAFGTDKWNTDLEDLIFNKEIKINRFSSELIGKIVMIAIIGLIVSLIIK